MMRLVKAGLIFGNLVEVRSPALVARYNRALKHLVGRETQLTEFHVDISGYSPEIGDEFGDTLYLNPNGVNRMFILLTTAQKSAPLINAQFSTSREIIKDFILKNERQLFALTAREAVAGELVNSVYRVDEPRDLFSIRLIEIEADTVQSHIAGGQELTQMISRFNGEVDAWWDDVLIADMIEMAKKTGDITRSSYHLEHKKFAQGNFYTKHFGGLYVFRDLDQSGIIAVDPDADLDRLPVDRKMHFDKPNNIATFLLNNNLIEPIVHQKDARTIAILQQKMDFITISVAAAKGADLRNLKRQDLRAISRKHIKDLPDEFHDLARLYHWATQGGKWPKITSGRASYFYTQRSTQNPNRDLVNMLLAHLCPLDFRQLFICHKDAFYAAYANWPDHQRDYVVQFLTEEYLVDKAGARDHLFGPDHTMRLDDQDDDQDYDRNEDDDDDDDDDYDMDKMLSRVGPWGAIRR